METKTRPRGLRSGRLKAIKRVVVGKPMETSRLAHERLGKLTALAVFASDNLSSSAYATEEILRVLVIAGSVGAVAYGLVVPITGALLAVLAVLLFSYRQTIHAYPQAGGAYLVTRDNFGVLPAQVAGVALLTDYILTVSVSVAAGTAALTSAAPGLFAWRVPLCVVFIAVITWGNLRGVKESGRIFAVPTYFFILMMAVVSGFGFYRMATGTLHASTTFPTPKATGAVTVFLVLKAFASGGAAVTGVEAISNGVPAFKAPEWRNARTTLMWMGALLGSMFLSLSIMAAHMHVGVDPTEKVTVISQIGRAAFGGGALGNALFFMLQAATFFILVLAANTSYADFPRLASFHAGDRFLPSQLTRFGDRLVFSNGILVLAAFATLLVVMFQASVTRLIPLYAIGVFTSFTFSQSGMAVRHTKLREPGWRRGFVINGFGGIVSGVMTVVIAVVKFTSGAWIILIAIPTILAFLLRINKHYTDVGRILRDPGRRPPQDTPQQRVIIAVDQPGHADRLAAAYAGKIRPAETRVVHVGSPDYKGLIEEWSRFGISETLEIIPATNSLAADLRSYVRRVRSEVGPHQMLNVVIPETVARTGTRHIMQRPTVQLLKAALIAEPEVVVTNVTYHEGVADPQPTHAGDRRHIAIVMVSAVHNATLRAIRHARSIHPDELHCIHVEVDPHQTARVTTEWEAWAPGASLEVLESPYRQITGPIVSWVRTFLTEDPDTLITIVLPEFVVARWWHNLLHNQTALMLKQAFLFEPSVAVTSVPYKLRPDVATTANR